MRNSPCRLGLPDAGGTLVIADSLTHRIRRVTPDGSITTIAGTGNPGYNGDNHPVIQVAEKLECGIVGVNELVPATAPCPFGGIKDSGFGREGGYQRMDEFPYSKCVSIGL